MSAPHSKDSGEIRHPRELTDDEWIEQAKRIATPPTDDDRNVLVGMNRPATPEELRAFVDRENARIRRERGLPPLSTPSPGADSLSAAGERPLAESPEKGSTELG